MDTVGRQWSQRRDWRDTTARLGVLAAAKAELGREQLSPREYLCCSMEPGRPDTEILAH